MQINTIIYPTFLMIILTIFLYIKNYIDNQVAYKNNKVTGEYFKVYQGDVPENIAVSRQTLKNQFELPILFYLLISILISINKITIVDVIFAWIFVLSRYLHAYIRLSSNFVPFRAKLFIIGLFSLSTWWFYFIIKNLI